MKSGRVEVRAKSVDGLGRTGSFHITIIDRYEAEHPDNRVSGSVGSDPDCTGGQYLEAGGEFNAPVTHHGSGLYELTLRYANGTGQDATYSVYRGVYHSTDFGPILVRTVIRTLTLPSTGSWNTWAEYTFTLDLNSSQTKLGFIKTADVNGNARFDHLKAIFIGPFLPVNDIHFYGDIGNFDKTVIVGSTASFEAFVNPINASNPELKAQVTDEYGFSTDRATLVKSGNTYHLQTHKLGRVKVRFDSTDGSECFAEKIIDITSEVIEVEDADRVTIINGELNPTDPYNPTNGYAAPKMSGSSNYLEFQFDYDTPAVGNYDITFGFSAFYLRNFMYPKDVTFYVNEGTENESIQERSVPISEESKERYEYEPTNLTLGKGINTIRVKYTYDGSSSDVFSVSYMKLSFAGAVGTEIYQAENAAVAGNIKNAYRGYTGTGYVDAKADSITFDVQRQTAGTYGLSVRYAHPFDSDVNYSLYVNGVKVKQLSMPGISLEKREWTDWTDVTEIVSLNAGSNTITIRRDAGDDGNAAIDCIKVFPFEMVTSIAVRAGFDDSLLGYWRLDEENLDDKIIRSACSDSGGGTLKGSGTVSGAGTPKTGFYNPRSLIFNGSGYVEVDNAPDISGKSFSIGFWVKRARTGSVDWIIGQGQTGQDMGLHLGFRENDAFSFAFFADDLDIPASDYINDTEWHHWLATYDAATKTQCVYQDGRLVGSRLAGNHLLSAGSLRIGAGVSASGSFSGNIDDVQIHNRVLTPTEAQRLASGIEVIGRYQIAPRRTLQMSAAVGDEYATVKSVTWSVHRTDGTPASRASIDQNGLLSAYAPAVVVVRATAKDGSGVSAETTVKIADIYEAENANFTGANKNSNHPNFSGNGFVEINANIEFSIATIQNGYYDLDIRYATPAEGGATYSLYFGDKKIKQLFFPKTGASWSEWGIITENIPVASPVDKITIKPDAGDSGQANIDFLSITPVGDLTLADNITLSSDGNKTFITSGNTLQMYAAITPGNASIKEVKWSVVSLGGTATISADGLLTGGTIGQVKVIAETTDGSVRDGVIMKDEKIITVGTLYEAEDAELTDAVVYHDAYPGFSGTGFVGEWASKIKFNTSLAGPRFYDLEFRFLNVGFNGTYSLYVNEKKIKQLVFGYTGPSEWGVLTQRIPVASVPVTSVSIKKDSGDNGTANIDCLLIKPADPLNPVSSILVNSAGGLLTALKPGSVWVIATAADSSGVKGEKLIYIATPAYSVSVSASTLTPVAGEEFLLYFAVRDNYDDVDASFNGNMNVTAYNIVPSPSGSYGLLNGQSISDGTFSTAVTFTAGLATVPVRLDAAAAQGLRFSVQNVSNYSDTVTVTPQHAAAEALKVHQHISAPAENGAVFAVQPKVALADPFGNICTSISGVTVTAAKSDAGRWVLTGGMSVIANAGIAAFTDLAAINTETVAAALLRFTAAGVTPAESDPVSLPASSSARRFEVVMPTNIAAGTPFSVTVKARNASGGIDTAFTGPVVFSSSDDGAVLPQNAEFTAADRGEKTFTVTLNAIGRQTVSVSRPSDASLVGHWRFDEGIGSSVSDSAGSSNGIIKGGGTVWNTDAPGTCFPNPSWLEFSGSGYAEISPAPDIANKSFSIGFWAKRSRSATDEWIIAQGPAVTDKRAAHRIPGK